MVNLTMASKIFISVLCIKGLVEAYLDKRNIKHIGKHFNAVPEEFADKITLEDHQKAARYTMEKLNKGQLFNFIGYIILVVWTLGGGLDTLNKWVLSLELSPLFTGTVFILAFSFINSILALPESLYSTFVIEEKYGFNKTTFKTFVTDMIKGSLLGLIIGIPLTR